ncbi:MAG: diacylglycerol kinase [Casimicrobiaceae bacterium]
MSAPSENPFKSRGGVRRIWNATRYSLQGFAHALRHEAAFRQELAMLAITFAIAWWAAVPWLHLALLAIAGSLVLAVELLNSAVEAAVDRISLEAHPLSGRAKDLGSAAVAVVLVVYTLLWAVCVALALGWL